MGASLQCLVAQVFDESRGNLVRIRPIGNLQVEDLENRRAWQVEAKRLPRAVARIQSRRASSPHPSSKDA